MTTQNNANQKGTFIVMSSSAHMPNSCWGIYRNVAIVEIEPGFGERPSMISDRARGVRRVVRHFGPQNVGKTSRCAFARTFAAAQQMADEMNDPRRQ